MVIVLPQPPDWIHTAHERRGVVHPFTETVARVPEEWGWTSARILIKEKSCQELLIEVDYWDSSASNSSRVIQIKADVYVLREDAPDNMYDYTSHLLNAKSRIRVSSMDGEQEAVRHEITTYGIDTLWAYFRLLLEERALDPDKVRKGCKAPDELVEQAKNDRVECDKLLTA